MTQEWQVTITADNLPPLTADEQRHLADTLGPALYDQEKKRLTVISRVTALAPVEAAITAQGNLEVFFPSPAGNPEAFFPPPARIIKMTIATAESVEEEHGNDLRLLFPDPEQP